MKRLAVLIKEQIQQLGNPSLREWLLSHFREDANTLWELFSESQEVISTHEEQAPALFPIQKIPNSLAVCLFSTYAPSSLREEFSRHFLVSAEQISDEGESSRLEWIVN